MWFTGFCLRNSYAWGRAMIRIAQELEHPRGEHYMTSLAALLDPQQHALTVEIGHIQAHHLGDAQARAVSR